MISFIVRKSWENQVGIILSQQTNTTYINGKWIDTAKIHIHQDSSLEEIDCTGYYGLIDSIVLPIDRISKDLQIQAFRVGKKGELMPIRNKEDIDDITTGRNENNVEKFHESMHGDSKLAKFNYKDLVYSNLDCKLSKPSR